MSFDPKLNTYLKTAQFAEHAERRAQIDQFKALTNPTYNNIKNAETSMNQARLTAWSNNNAYNAYIKGK